MRSSEFWELMRAEFGSAYAATLAREHVVSGLGERTAEQALAAGEDARSVWLAMCADLQVPRDRWLGKDDPRKAAASRRHD